MTDDVNELEGQTEETEETEETEDLREDLAEGTESQAARPPGGSPARTNTQQEVAYLKKLIESNLPVTVKVKGGDIIRGVIEYYDNSFIRVTREGEPNLFIFKKDIHYIVEGAAPPNPEEPAA